MMQTLRNPPEQILRDLGLTAERSSFSADVQEAFVTIVRPLLEQLGVSVEFAEIFSAAKRCTSAVIEGQRYIVFDHGLLDCFARLDRLNGASSNASLTAAAFQRLLAEAARAAQHVELYAFFIRRALEVEPLFRQNETSDNVAFVRFWQAAFVLCHEAAHALPHDHAARCALDAGATASVSALTNELISGLTGQLMDMFDDADNQERRSLQDDLDEWLASKDDLNLGDDAIFDTYEAVGTDPRFLDEVACDSFAVSGLLQALVTLRTAVPPEGFGKLWISALTAAYSGFLHHRLVSYFADILSQLPLHLSVKHIDPLKLRLIVEISLRSNLVVLQMLDAARELDGDSAADILRNEFGAIQAAHTTNLFEVGDRLIAMTVLNDEFHNSLHGMLAQDKVDLEEIDEDPLSVFLETDSLWQKLVQA